ncbi:MAG: tetratricopeptide repeat protein [Brevinematia bacterium]
MDCNFIFLILGVMVFVGTIVIILSLYFYRRELELTEIKNSLEKKEFEKAIRLSKEYLKKSPPNFNIYYCLAKAYDGVNNYKAAIEYYEKSLVELQKYPKSALKAEIMLRLGDLYLAIEEKNVAIGCFKMVLEEFPNNLYSLWQLGKVYFKENNFLKAREYLERLVSIKPIYPEAYLLLAKSYYNLQNYQNALNYLNLWFEKGSDRSASVEEYNKSLIFLSDIYVALKRYNEAISVLKPLLEDERSTGEALIRLIQIYIRMGDFSKAIQLGDDFLLKIPKEDKAGVFYELANAYAGGGEIYKAIDMWHSVNNVRPGYRDVVQILEKYKVLVENRFLENYFTNDEATFSNLILRKFNIKEFNIFYRDKTFWIIKDDPDCRILHREAISLLPVKLNEMENILIDEGLSTYSVTLYTLFEVDKGCYSINFYRKIRVVSGEAFLTFFRD